MFHAKILFLELVADEMGKDFNLRFGQTVFNLMYELYPSRAEILRCSNFDPFYRDDRAMSFIDKCFTLTNY